MDELNAVVIPTAESVAEMVAEVTPPLDPQTLADAADFAGMVAGDPDATQRYLDSLLRVIELVNDTSRLVEVLPLW